MDWSSTHPEVCERLVYAFLVWIFPKSSKGQSIEDESNGLHFSRLIADLLNVVFTVCMAAAGSPNSWVRKAKLQASFMTWKGCNQSHSLLVKKKHENNAKIHQMSSFTYIYKDLASETRFRGKIHSLWLQRGGLGEEDSSGVEVSRPCTLKYRCKTSNSRNPKHQIIYIYMYIYKVAIIYYLALSSISFTPQIPQKIQTFNLYHKSKSQNPCLRLPRSVTGAWQIPHSLFEQPASTRTPTSWTQVTSDLSISFNLGDRKTHQKWIKNKKLRNPAEFFSIFQVAWVKHSTDIKYSDFLLQPNIHSHNVRAQCFRCQSTLECPITSEHHSSPWLPKIGSIGHPSTRTNRILPIQIPGDMAIGG